MNAMSLEGLAPTPEALTRKGGKNGDGKGGSRLLPSLLLCYPPPSSSMADDCLDAYPGSVLLYIGEWRGNTATREFEARLLREWVLEERLVLPAWGSEAAVLTAWRRQTQPDEPGLSSAGFPPQAPLQQELPCSRPGCGKHAVAQCRLCRSMLYCSEACATVPAEAKRHATLHESLCAHTGPIPFSSRGYEFWPARDAGVRSGRKWGPGRRLTSSVLPRPTK